jgi:hypothetical protein
MAGVLAAEEASAVVVAIVVVMVIVIGVLGLRDVTSAARCFDDRRSLDDLLEFATIKPHTTTRRAVVNLHTLTVGHYQIHFFACRTLHV